MAIQVNQETLLKMLYILLQITKKFITKNNPVGCDIKWRRGQPADVLQTLAGKDSHPNNLAEGEGFEPSEVLTPHTLSKRAH